MLSRLNCVIMHLMGGVSWGGGPLGGFGESTFLRQAHLMEVAYAEVCSKFMHRRECLPLMRVSGYALR